MFFCVAEGHVEDGDLEEASVASEGDPIRSASKLDGQRSRTLNDSEACACCDYENPIVYRWTCSKQSFSKTRISWAWINIKNLDNLRLPVTVAGLFLAQKSGLDTRCMTRSYAALKFLNCFSGRLP